MEALLKLIVGVDGVTASMLLQVAWLYVASTAVQAIAWAAGAVSVIWIICRTIIQVQLKAK